MFLGFAFSCHRQSVSGSRSTSNRAGSQGAAFKHLSEHEAHEVQFTLSQKAREADRPIKEQAWLAYAPSGQIVLRHRAEQIRRSQSGRAA